MSKFVTVLLIILVILFIIGAMTTNSHVANSFCGTLESLFSCLTGICMNIVHGLTWIVRGISGIVS